MSLIDTFDEDDQDVGWNPQAAVAPTLNYASNNNNVNRSREEEDALFRLERVGYKPNGLKHMVVCSNILIMSLNNCHIIRLHLNNESDLEDIEISRKPEDQIHKLFLDPTGNHLIITMESEDNYYIHKNWKKPKVLSKMKGVIVESVAWDRSNTDTLTTKEILIGTNKGRIYETCIEANEKAFMERLVGAKEQIFKPIYNVGENAPITGLKYEKFATSSNEPNKYFIMLTTPTRIYQFIGGPTFENVFSNYETNPGFQELPGDLNYSELQFFSKYQGLPKSFVWLTGPGIYYGDLIFGSQIPGESVMTDTSLLPYPNSDIPPLSLVLTEFHFLLLYSDKIQAICTLNKQVVWEENFPKSQKLGRMVGLAYDPFEKTVWVFGEYSVFELVITKEDRNVWQLYLDKGQYEAALQYCKNSIQRDKVWTVQADYYFSTNNYRLAAIYYAKTAKSFEEVTLKFITNNDQNALKTYLLHKLENIKSNKSEEMTQLTLIATWLTEIYLDKLNQLEDSNQKDAFEVAKEEFEQFLKDYKDNLNKSNTTCNLLASHGRIEQLLYFTLLIEDYEYVISHYIQNHQYKEALDVMTKQFSEDLYYKFSPVLMHYLPYQTVNAWLKAKDLDPRKLIPALMRYDPANNPPNIKENQAIKYLEQVIKKTKDPAIHNYLISLYAQQRDEGPLLNFLQLPETYYDLKYALRLCIKESKSAACVLLYSAMGLYEEAVELALTVDIDLAKNNAEKPEDDDTLRKKLWLRIARYLVEEKKDIKKAMELLNQCPLLKIEDILPFFPDFTRIDDFKSEICTSLEDYNRHIEELKTEMDEATNSADLIRMDIKELRNKYGYVSSTQKCGICDHLVLSKEFYLFPCQHVFHADCLLSKMMEYLDSVQRNRVIDLLQQIQQLSSKEVKKKSIGTSTNEEKEINVVVSKIDKVKDELDDYIASECVLCGDIMINQIDQPFVKPDDPDTLSWQIS